MTENNPIMIDGIDVKECTCFSNWHTIMTGTGIIYKEVENCCTPQQKPCKDIKNCCFKKLAKQLARKTQECEELKEDYTLMKQSRDLALKNYEEEFEYKRKITAEHLEQKKELLKQLDQLKEELQEYQDWFDEFKLMFRYDDREPDNNSELYSCLEHVFDENKKLKQTITEIKKIANYSFNLQTSAYTAKLELILERINEVENILQILEEVK